jgi:alpha-beta hydrolase superfamily lysophospholipase
MFDDTFQFDSETDGLPIHGFKWFAASPKALLVISHGAAEHALRYDRFARALNVEGITVWANDHRGHGTSAGPEGLGDFGPGGWDALVDDIGQLIQVAREANPGLPVVLMGHSMGAMAAQQFAPSGSNTVDALILSGTTAREVPPEGSPPPVFAPNKPFEPGRTGYEWLSRDEAEVDKYVADPLCGFETRRVNPANIRANPARLADPAEHRRIRSGLPVLFVAGDQDPINRNLEGLHLLERWWRDGGVQQIDKLYYPGGRHEMLNETNRDEVTADIVAWIRRTLAI